MPFDAPDIQRIIDDPRYSISAMADALLEIPNQYDLLGQLGLFPERGIATTYVEIERKAGVLNLIPTTERGGPATKARSKKRDKIIVGTEYMKHEDSLLAEALQNLPMFGTDEFFEQFDLLLNEKFEDLYAKFRQTHEFMRWGALRGDVLDADGATVLYNCYDLMGEEQESIDFKFGTTSDDGPLAAAKTARRYLEKNLKGETMSGMLVIGSSGFMDGLTSHPRIQKIYEQQQLTGVRPNPLLDDVYDGFTHGGVTYVEHNGVASYVDPETGEETEHAFVPEDEAIMIPLGTRQTFRSYFAPGTSMDTVNRPGQAMHVKMKPMDWDDGIELRAESAPLFLTQRPRLVLRGHSSN